MAKFKYTHDIPRKMYSFFTSYDGPGAPSFGKFARSVGITNSALMELRKHRKFDEAYRECNEIRNQKRLSYRQCVS